MVAVEDGDPFGPSVIVSVHFDRHGVLVTVSLTALVKDVTHVPKAPACDIGPALGLEHYGDMTVALEMFLEQLNRINQPDQIRLVAAVEELDAHSGSIKITPRGR